MTVNQAIQYKGRFVKDHPAFMRAGTEANVYTIDFLTTVGGTWYAVCVGADGTEKRIRPMYLTTSLKKTEGKQ